MSIKRQHRWISWKTEKTALQATVAVACLVPIIAGGYGMVHGLATSADGVGITSLPLDSHTRYLSGLLFAIGLGFVSTIGHIERRGNRIRLLAALVVIGGLGRLLGLILVGTPSSSMLAALGMELVVTPLLVLWQARVVRRARSGLERYPARLR